MTKDTFVDDVFSRQVIRFLLLLQIGAMILVLMLSGRGHALLGLGISILTLILCVVIVIVLYIRYQNLPIVREKSALEQRIHKFQKSVQTEGHSLAEAARKRDELIEAEKNEIENALSNVQDAYIEYGLTSATIKDAAIPGIGPKLKERLAEHGILAAAQVNDQISELPGFGEAKYKDLLNWRSVVLAALENTKPSSLRQERQEAIKRHYEKLHEQNDLGVRDALESRNILEHELRSFVPQFEGMAPVSFVAYLSSSLASRGMIAASFAFLLIVTQLVSSVTATAATIASIMAPKLTERASAVVTPTSHVLPPATIASSQIIPSRIPNTPGETLPPLATATSAALLASQPTLPAVAIASCIPRNTSREVALVTGIVDGDTIDVQVGGQTFRVRYIGIDTPEQNEAFFSEATAYNQSLILNKTVTLVKDQSETDSFGRLLRYVVLDNTFVNYELVKSGYASAAAYAPDISCSTAFEVAQGQAQVASLGVWMVTPGAYIAPVTGGGNGGNCDPSYPGVCIPPPPPDLDCKDIPFKRFTVVPPDPHGFDKDGDGVGCEN